MRASRTSSLWVLAHPLAINRQHASPRKWFGMTDPALVVVGGISHTFSNTRAKLGSGAAPELEPCLGVSADDACALNDVRTAKHAAKGPGRASPSAIEDALGCLAHPSSVAAVLLLLVNDHLLKGRWPGWLTGKLSDFAGLYFFPFLLMLLLAPLSFWLAPRSVGQLAFALTALWFAGVKLSAPVHRLTLLLVEGLIGGAAGPVSIARDPSDVWALLSLLPAWALWRYSASADAPARRRTQVAVLTVAALACMATPATEHADNDAVVRLERRGDTIVATVRTFGRPDHCSEYWYQHPDSWHLLPACGNGDQDPAALADGPEPVARAELAHPRDPRYRLRRAGEALTSIGLDVSWQAGASWSPAWRVPYAAAAYHAATYDQTDPIEDFRVYDLIWSYGEHETIVALGTEGVLIGRQGNWRRVAVGSVTPDLPFSELESRWSLIARTWPLGLLELWVTLGVLAPIARWQSRRRDPTLPRGKHVLARALGWWLTLACAVLIAIFFNVMQLIGLALAVLLAPLFVLFVSHQLVTRRSRTRLEHVAAWASMAAGVLAMLAAGSVGYGYALAPRAADGAVLGRLLLVTAVPFACALALQLRVGRREKS
jgi:hypothetical protein